MMRSNRRTLANVWPSLRTILLRTIRQTAGSGLFLLLPLLASPPLSVMATDDSAPTAEGLDARITAALESAGDNRPQIELALARSPEDQRDGMRFLVANMPPRDLQALTAEYLLENSDLAYAEFRAAPWRDQVPREIFLNDVLPYASINERRDAWRKDFVARFKPLVKDAATPAAAAAILNQQIFGLLNVKYSTARPKADQSPIESIQAGLASCSGLTVLLIDACRAVGVPARFVGTPLWIDKSGNHSWVEVWDQGWHFTGAAEPSGDKLDEAWFITRASGAKRDQPLHAIYASSFRKTPIHFPLVWDRQIRYVHAVNVTDRYVGRAEPLPDGFRRVMFRALLVPTNRRCAAALELRDDGNEVVWSGETNDERFDANDHRIVALRDGSTYQAVAEFEGRKAELQFQVGPDRGTVTLELAVPGNSRGSPGAGTPADGSAVLKELRRYLAQEVDSRPALAAQNFAGQSLTRAEAEEAATLLWEDHAANVRRTRDEEMRNRRLKIGDLEMPFHYQIFGEAAPDGRALFISLHGGGGAPKEVNDRQWENQKKLYRPDEGVYVAPRAPTNTWDLWHQSHIDRFFDRLIQNLIVFENVNPERVYLTGYSAGGDGVYQLAPRMADRWAAAAMMAGHPNEASPLGLRNLPFAIQVGGKDSAYNRNKVAMEWGEKLDKLRESDPNGYEHWVRIHADKGHWMDREDAVAIPWMAKFRRQSTPERIVWFQDDVTEPRFYWLAVADEQRKAGSKVVATRQGQTIAIEAEQVRELRVRLNDAMVDLDESVEITGSGKPRFNGRLARTIRCLAETLAERGDPRGVYSVEVTVTLD